jgi:hypothetical protein
MGMDLERQLGFLSDALDHPVEAIGGEWSAALSHEYEGTGGLLAKLAQLAQFIAADWMSRRLAGLPAADMHLGSGEVDR